MSRFPDDPTLDQRDLIKAAEKAFEDLGCRIVREGYDPEMANMNLTREGFWAEEEGKPEKDGAVLPWPRDMRGSAYYFDYEEFLTDLNFVERKISALGGSVAHYRGSSTCRLCGVRNGSSAYSLRPFVWPEGFAHYVGEHGIIPTLAFREFIIARHADASKLAVEEAARIYKERELCRGATDAKDSSE